METIWIPILAIAGLIFLFRFQRGKSESGSGTEGGFGCGMGCCGGGHFPPEARGEGREGKKIKSFLA